MPSDYYTKVLLKVWPDGQWSYEQSLSFRSDFFVLRFLGPNRKVKGLKC